MRTRSLVPLVLVSVLFGTAVPGGGAPVARAQGACDFAELYDETVPSVVSIRVAGVGGAGEGSGFVYDGSGHVVTNYHVVSGASSLDVGFSRGEWRRAEVVGADPDTDLAVLRVEDVPGYATPLSLTDDAVQPGESVAALGSPLGLRGSITQGIVSGVNRSIPTPEGEPIPDTIQTDAAINPGNSGGPLVNCEGEVVGVNSAGIVGGENLGFAVSADIVRRTVPPMVGNGSVREGREGNVRKGAVGRISR